ncbi:hypothetical protein GCM10010214_09750 [Streptomyces abikoensis]|nr:hypothetical protein GCM10010214_09750 [Streptomyces abikoensis]
MQGVLEERERVTPAGTEGLRGQPEELQAAMAEAEGGYWCRCVITNEHAPIEWGGRGESSQAGFAARLTASAKSMWFMPLGVGPSIGAQ